MTDMNYLWFLLLFLSKLYSSIGDGNSLAKPPTIFVAVFIRENASTLPYFLTLFTHIQYPKDRMRVWSVQYITRKC